MAHNNRKNQQLIFSQPANPLSQPVVSNSNNKFQSKSQYFFDLNDLKQRNSNGNLSNTYGIYRPNDILYPSSQQQHPNTTSPSSSSSNNTDSSNVSSQQLATKLRKIKQNLDNCYFINDTNNNHNNNDSFKNINRVPISYNNIHNNRINNNQKTSLDMILNQFADANLMDSSAYGHIIPISTEFMAPHINIYKPNGIQSKHSDMNKTAAAIYTDNVSRQSSIRSLLTSTNDINKNKNSNLLLISPSQMLNNQVTSNFAKIKQTNLNQKTQDNRPQPLIAIVNNSINQRVLAEPLATRSETNLDFGFSNKNDDIEERTHSPMKKPSNKFLKSNGNIIYEQNFDEDADDDSFDENQETDSILSVFKTSLNFDETKSSNFSANPNPNKSKNVNIVNDNTNNNNTYNQDFDCITNSDVLSNASSIINNNKFIIREKIKKPSNKNNYVEYSTPDTNSRESFSSNEKLKNYQRLSSSINNLFSNLIQHLEVQKNRDYLDELGVDTKARNSTQNLYLSPNNNINKVINSPSHSNKMSPNLILNNKNSNNSNKDSNKDSGFNQESIYTYKNGSMNKKTNVVDNNYQNEPKLSLLERYLNNEQFITYKHAQIDKLLFGNDQNKAKNLDSLDDYSINEYILNQEGISINTFKQLIKEKYNKFEWPDDLLNKLYLIVNQTNESIKNNSDYENCDSLSINERNTEMEDDEEEDLYNQDEFECLQQFNSEDYELGYQERNNIENNSSKKLSSILKNGVIQLKQIEDANIDNSNSPSTSTKSYRKIKDIKNATSLKKKQLHLATDTSEVFSDLNETLNGNVDEVTNRQKILDEKQADLKKSLSNSFKKRRNRKGSLPEINPNHLSSFKNNFSNNNNCELKSPSFLSFQNSSVINPNETNLNTTIDTVSALNNQSGEQRQSRKSAFILEVMRSSMFRSKSLTDLNSSILKPAEQTSSFATFNSSTRQQRSSTLNKYSNATNKFSIYNGLNESNQNIDCYQSNLNLSCTKIDCLSQINKLDELSYAGLIWQCADMYYNEYRNKYKELRWLLNGDRFSTTSKLKEVEQRLKIELNLKEKNINLLQDLKKTHDKQIHSRLVGQIKLIDDKVKELESMRLFLKICEINSHSLDKENLDEFFGKSEYPIISNSNNDQHQNNLQAKSINDIIKTLYGNEAIINGFVYHFFVVYRYMFSSAKLFIMLKDNFLKAKSLRKSNEKFNLVLDRTIDLIAMWIDGFFIIDFQQNQELIDETERFISNDIRLFDEEKSKVLLDLLHNPQIEFNLFVNNKVSKKLKKIKKITHESKKSTSILSGSQLKKRILSRTRSSSKNKQDLNDTLNSTLVNAVINKRESFSLFDHSIELISTQLTLLEWDNFMDIHVCHCLNSKAQGVNCDSKQPIDPNSINVEQCLFVDNYLSKSVYKMMQFNYMLTHWVSAEILLLESIKTQAALITKFVKIAKFCYKSSNFSTAFSIYDGLQDITIKNLPAWQQLSNKTIQILDKIAAFKVLFQNESRMINELSKTSSNPVIPSMHLFLLIVQQNEHGSFQLKNGQWKWSKLESLANLVDQIRITQQHYLCNFEQCEEFVDDLLQRIYYLKDFDLNHLAENNNLDHFTQKMLNTTNNSTTAIKNLISNNKKKFNLN